MRSIILTLIFSVLVQLAQGQKAELLDKANSNLVDNNLLSVSVDNNGNKWIGTSKFGLVRYDDESFFLFDTSNSVILGNYISPIFTDSKGQIWVTYSQPTDGIAKFNGSWTSFSKEELPVDRLSIISIAEAPNGTLYFGGGEGLLSFDGKDWKKIPLPNDESNSYVIRAIDINDNGDIAIGHNSGLLYQVDGNWVSLNEDNSEMLLDVVRAVKYVLPDQLYIGYGGGFGNGGFSIINGENWEHFNKSNSTIPDHMVRDIEVGKDGTIWMATNNGVIMKKGPNLTSIMFREGMYQNTILDIAIDKETVWIATNFGLIKLK